MEDNEQLGKKYAEEQLKLALSAETQHNILGNTIQIIADGETAVKVAEAMLFLYL